MWRAVEDHSCIFAHNAEEGDSAIVTVAITAVTFVLVERANFRIPHVVGYRALFPALEQDLVQVANEKVLSSCLHKKSLVVFHRKVS